MKEKTLLKGIMGLALAVTLAACVINEAAGNAPSAPLSVYATASSSSITVTWSSVSAAEGYRVYRSTSSYGTYSFCGSSATASYTDTGLSANTIYILQSNGM
jgi:fibronectin type 3 domain-containing protein